MTSIFKQSFSSLSHRNDNRTSSALSHSSKLNAPSSTQSPQANTVGFNLSCLDLTKKQPFLPKLPEKLVRFSRLSTTHLINDYYVDPDESKNLNKQKLGKRFKSFTFKGDLLKASQVLLVLDNNMSDSIKHVKTADSPWAKNAPSRSTSAKPCRSALLKNRVESASYLRNTASSLNIHSSQSLRSSSSLNPDRERWKAPSSLYKNSSTDTFYTNRIFTDLEKNPVKIQKFAEDLLNYHIKKSTSGRSSANSVKSEEIDEITTLPDIALHALDTIWEIHSSVFKYSPYLIELLEKKKYALQEAEMEKKIQASKEKSKTSIATENLDKFTHLILEIEDSSINKHSLAVALGNLYHPDKIEIPGKLASGALAAAHLLKFDELKSAAVDKISHSLTKKNIVDCYKTAVKYDEERAIRICEKWMEMYLISDMGSSIFLRRVPLELLIKTLKSTKMFTLNEYAIFMLLINWVFLNLNPDLEELPSESIITTYFTSLPKEKELIESIPELKEAFHIVRLYGITKSNHLTTIQNLNVYSHSYMAKIMMEIQQSLTHGGDMAVTRIFDVSAIRQGFIIDIEQSYYSEVFSLYGFYFELIAEKISDHKFQFHIQRLTTNNPILTYEQSQLETFSLRNDRYCTYSINVQYWHNGNQVLNSTGLRKQRFGKAKSQSTQPYAVEVPQADPSDEEVPVKELFVMYSFLFPAD